MHGYSSTENSQNIYQKPMTQNDKKNDYCQHFVNTGERPQNFIRDIKPDEWFVDYPKLDQLIKLKDEIIKKRNTPPMYIKADLKKFDLKTIGKFDVILVDPPWEEYSKSLRGPIPVDNEKLNPWTFEEICGLDMDAIAEIPSFLFLWVGSESLELGRELFRKWGYKRCEDIIWVKTNKTGNRNKTIDRNIAIENGHILQRVKEHCLVGLKGDVRRASDSHFIHANIDTDVIVDEEPPLGSTQKSPEIYSIIERFCLGRKRIELFGEISSIRPGWLTIGKNLPESNFDLEIYNSWFEGEGAYPQIQEFKGGRYLGTTVEIENLRPKSPSRSSSSNKNNYDDSASKEDYYQKYPDYNYMMGGGAGGGSNSKGYPQMDRNNGGPAGKLIDVKKNLFSKNKKLKFHFPLNPRNFDL